MFLSAQEIQKNKLEKILRAIDIGVLIIGIKKVTKTPAIVAQAAALVIRIACGDICIKHLPKTVITINIKMIVAVIFDRKPIMLYQSFDKKRPCRIEIHFRITFADCRDRTAIYTL
jgi:hypothetical protein